ncbi:MAG: YceH family protein [Rhodocyclales bacterium]|nr:YceH family protein [Rhodocyclales bacterium]MBI5785917.1 YceH family protein [Rhodocyclales bacterium]
MSIELSPIEARIVGCLIEKEITTPEQYPLSLNALTNACNQKSNRDPVLELDEATVQRTLDQLVKRYLVSEHGGFGSRVAKYQHRFCNTEYGTLKFTPQELGIVCELLLRGPQTPGELRSRASRLCPLKDVTEVEAALDALARREDGPFVKRLPREPGKRESRFAHLFGGEIEDADEIESLAAATPESATIAQLEQRVAQLEAAMLEMKALIDSLRQTDTPTNDD